MKKAKIDQNQPVNLLIQQAALGDWVLTFPIMRSLGPTAAIAPSSKANLAARILKGITPINAEHPELTRLFADDCEPPSEFESLFKNSKNIISFLGNGDDPWSRNVRRFAPDAVIAFLTTIPPPSWFGHLLNWQFKQLRDQGITLESSASLSTRSSLNGPVVIHPGSGSQEKCWPRKRFEELMRCLIDNGIPVRAILGEVEMETWAEKEVDHWRTEFSALAIDKLDLLFDILGNARSFVGNDSGPTHLAASMGLPTVALFGPTSSATWAPIGPSVTVIESMMQAGVDSVISAIESMVPC